MSHRGRVTNGHIVLDPPARLPEGAEVIVEVIAPRPSDESHIPKRPLMRFAGQAHGLPHDASETIDRVLYGREAQ